MSPVGGRCRPRLRAIAVDEEVFNAVGEIDYPDKLRHVLAEAIRGLIMIMP